MREKCEVRSLAAINHEKNILKHKDHYSLYFVYRRIFLEHTPAMNEGPLPPCFRGHFLSV